MSSDVGAMKRDAHVGVGIISLIHWYTRGASIPAFSLNVKTSARSSSEPRIMELPMSLKVIAECGTNIEEGQHTGMQAKYSHFSMLPPRSMTFLPTAGTKR